MVASARDSARLADLLSRIRVLEQTVRQIPSRVGSPEPVAADPPSVTKSIAQAAHGFAVGDVVTRLAGASSWTLALNGSNNFPRVDWEEMGIVSAVADADNFTVTLDGIMDGMSGLTAGWRYYLSATAGDLVREDNLGNDDPPQICIAISATKVVVDVGIARNLFVKDHLFFTFTAYGNAGDSGKIVWFDDPQATDSSALERLTISNQGGFRIAYTAPSGGTSGSIIRFDMVTEEVTIDYPLNASFAQIKSTDIIIYDTDTTDANDQVAILDPSLSGGNPILGIRLSDSGISKGGLSLTANHGTNQFTFTVSDYPMTGKMIQAQDDGGTIKLGFFGVTMVEQPVLVATGASTVTGTADSTYNATEQNMLNDIKTNFNALKGQFDELRAALIDLGLVS